LPRGEANDVTDKVNALGNSRPKRRRVYICVGIYVGFYIPDGGGKEVVKSTEGQGDVDQPGPGGNTAQMLEAVIVSNRHGECALWYFHITSPSN
jgi:hypothetical protein